MHRINLFYFSRSDLDFPYLLFLGLVYLVFVPFVPDLGPTTIQLLQETPDEDVNHFVVLVLLEICPAFLAVQETFIVDWARHWVSLAEISDCSFGVKEVHPPFYPDIRNHTIATRFNFLVFNNLLLFYFFPVPNLFNLVHAERAFLFPKLVPLEHLQQVLINFPRHPLLLPHLRLHLRPKFPMFAHLLQVEVAGDLIF